MDSISNKVKIFSIVVICLFFGSCGDSSVITDVETGSDVAMFPDYSGVTIPTAIAPLNFRINEDGEKFHAEFSNSTGGVLGITSSDGDIKIPIGKWRKFCAGAEGTTFTIKVAVKKDGKWQGYNTIENDFAKDEIDSHIVYRLIYPGYTLWSTMGIYQRELSSYEQNTIVDNQSNEVGCMNCHTFSSNSPEKMMLHIRKNRGGTVIARDGKADKFTTKTGTMYADGVYSSWSRDGRYIAYSTNDVKQVFHASDPKAIEVFDQKSDLVIYDIEKNEMISDTAIRSDKYMETFPDWSPDGKYIYFCRALPFNGDNKSLTGSRYDLCRIGFDASTNSFGKVELIYEASALGKSVSFPKCSPDGRYLVFTESDYGTFSIWHPESDLCLMDLQTMQVRLLDEINSDNVDSYHSWSSNGRWMVFSSKRQGGIWARPYFASFDPENGRFGKPFVLPQKSPDHYFGQMETYNIPQFVTGKVKMSSAIIDAIRSEPTQINAGKGVR